MKKMLNKKKNEFEELMNQGYFQELFNKLEELNFSYYLDEFDALFQKGKAEYKYAYLTYLIARSEKPEYHILLCDMLLYTDMLFFHDRYTVQKWHLLRALEISPNNLDVLDWIIGVFNNSPDSPFTDDEMLRFEKQRKRVNYQHVIE